MTKMLLVDPDPGILAAEDRSSIVETGLQVSEALYEIFLVQIDKLNLAPMEASESEIA